MLFRCDHHLAPLFLYSWDVHVGLVKHQVSRVITEMMSMDTVNDTAVLEKTDSARVSSPGFGSLRGAEMVNGTSVAVAYFLAQ